MTRKLVVAVLAVVVACNKKSENPKPERQLPPADAAVAQATPDAAPADHDRDEVAAKLVPDTAPAQRLWTPKLADDETFHAYSKEIGNERFAKFVIDLKS